jgi:hypothetical protein
VKLETIAAAVLVGALAAGTLPLMKAFRGLRSQIRQEHISADITRQNLIVRSIRGVDVSGRPRFELQPAKAKRFVLFGLRSATVSEELRIWDSLASHLVNEPNVYLIAYCDGVACASAVSRTHPSSTLAVLAYGEPITVQAVLNADAKGQFLVVDGALRPLRSVSWRGPDRGTLDILAREVLK